MTTKTKAVLDAAEKTLNEVEPVLTRIESEIEQTAEAASRIPKLWLNGTTKKQQILILSITAAGGAAAATAVCMTALKKRYQYKYSQIAEQEIQDAREFFQATMNKPELSDLIKDSGIEPKVAQAGKAFQSYQGAGLQYPTPEARPVEGVVDAEPNTTHNIFVEGIPVDDNFDYEAEIANRSVDAPYIISKDEYNAGEKEYDQEELTYYEGDDTLADSKGKHIPDQDETVGDMNLHRFGHGSNDNNVLYVRNDRLELDFIVLKSTGEYGKEVLGLRHSEDGRHSGSRKQPKARWGDDG